MDFKFVERTENTTFRKISFLNKDDIAGIETGKVGTRSVEMPFLEAVVIYTKSSPPLTFTFESIEERDRFIQELTEGYNPKEFSVSFKK